MFQAWPALTQFSRLQSQPEVVEPAPPPPPEVRTPAPSIGKLLSMRLWADTAPDPNPQPEPEPVVEPPPPPPTEPEVRCAFDALD